MEGTSLKQPVPKKVALVHDFLFSYGGAERVLEALCEMYPEAPIYTLLYDQERMGEHFRGRDIRVSWLKHLPRFIQKRYRLLLPFFPVAVESIDLREFDVVISSSGAWSKGIITRLNTTHIAYLHSPMRYAWDYHEQYLGEIGARGKVRIFSRMLLSYLRIWDRQAALRPDVLLANSRYTAARIKKYYRSLAAVIYPGALSLFEKVGNVSATRENKREYFLVVSRLTLSKKVDTVVAAFNKLGLPLVVVGEGKERTRLEKLAKSNIRFTGFVLDEQLAALYRGARALIFPAEEDFGMVAVEALSFGTPVIAFDYGGIREIVEEGVTGEWYHAQAAEIVAEGVRRFLAKEGTYDEGVMKQSVARFTKSRFQEELRVAVERASNN